MKIGYARVSTLEQNLDSQIDALKKEGCEKIITDEVSGSVADRLMFKGHEKPDCFYEFRPSQYHNLW